MAYSYTQSRYTKAAFKRNLHKSQVGMELEVNLVTQIRDERQRIRNQQHAVNQETPMRAAPDDSRRDLTFSSSMRVNTAAEPAPQSQSPEEQPSPPSQHSSSRREHQFMYPPFLTQSSVRSFTSVSSWIFGSERSPSPTSNQSRFRPPPVVLTSADHNIIHSATTEAMSPISASTGGARRFRHSTLPHQYEGIPNFGQDDLEEPDFSYLRGLLGLLLLATSLAWCSAIDSRFQCSSQEAYDVYELFDDDAVIFNQLQRLQEKQLCLEMFRLVMIPVGGVTGVLSMLALYLIRPAALLHIHEAPTNILRRQYCRDLCRRLLFTFPVVLCAWSYGVGAIMLQPRKDYYTGSDDNNPYHSLAAVDYMGYVGDNANLYYLSWLSLGLSLVIVYQIVTDAARQHRRYRQARSEESDQLGDIEAMLSFSKRQWKEYHESRATWFNSFYRLRIRTGIWVSACFASLVVTASSVHLWNDVLLPTAQSMSKSVRSFRQVCPTLKQYRYETEESLQLPPQLCARTSFSIVSGCIAATLCLGAVVLHMQVRHDAADVVEGQQQNTRNNNHHALVPHLRTFVHLSNKMYLQSEFTLSVLLCCSLGLNAVFATGVQGPASTVGNLYYSSWIAFLLCLRICLGCLEEMYNIENEEHEPEEEGMEMTLRSGQGEKAAKRKKAYEAPSLQQHHTNDQETVTTYIGSPSHHRQASVNTTTDLFDNHRARRLRRFLFLAIFSSICAASAIDAAVNQETELTGDQRYIMVAPSVVAVLCVIQFVMCLRTYTYAVLSNVCAGLLLSVLSFGLWLAALIIQMHSENSWAVNAVGDIKIANLYYFSWAAIITAGLHMTSYLALAWGWKKKDYMTIAWIAIVKVCFVIFGAGIHIWLSTRESCTFQDIQSGAVTFCSRTIFAIVVSLTGMLVGGLVAFTRIVISLCCPASSIRVRAHVEMIISMFLVLLFGVAVALITGIGGPGQSVGDLYYSTWLAFFVSIFVGMSSVREIVKQDRASDMRESSGKEISDETQFVQMR